MRIIIKRKPTEAILRARGLENFGRVQRYIDSDVMRLMNQYTPERNGELIRSATINTIIGSGRVVQGGTKAPYAVKCYYKPMKFQGAPRRGNRWFERMLNEGGREELKKGIERMSGGKFE